MISKETISLITSFQNPILKALEDVKTEVQFFMDNGLSDYIDSIKSKFENTKTFLYRNENVPFYDVFFPVSLKLNNEIKKLNIESDLFEKSNCASIIGNAGSGKTMLIKHVFLSCIKSSYKIPIFIELRNINGCDLSIIDYIYQIIFDNKLSPNQKILERLLSTGDFIILLDGYDEIFSNKKDKVTSDLDRFIDKYSKNNYIISSRPGSGIESLPRFNNYFVQPLNNREIYAFIDLVLKSNTDVLLAAKIKQVINRLENNDYRNFLNSPLLLSMFILTFDTYPELPRKKSKFYWNVFDTLATKHDSFTKKGGYQHERKTGLQNDEFEEILKWFSYISLFEGRYNFDAQYFSNKLNEIKKVIDFGYNTQLLIEDLTLSIAIIIIDGLEYKFPHKSLQEYFCAQLIKDQTEDKKEKIYKEKLKGQIVFSAGGNENFWNLCYELDYNSFVKNFLIFNLQELIASFENLSPIQITKKIYTESEYTENLVNKKGLIEFDGARSYKSSYGAYFKITRYLDLMSIDILAMSNYNDIEKIINFVIGNNTHINFNEDGRYNISYSKLWNEELEEILFDYGHVTLIVDFIQNIKLKIQYLENELNTNNSNTESLLLR